VVTSWTTTRRSTGGNRDRVATAQAEATKANKGLEALKNEARAQAQTHARAHAQALEAHAEVVRKIKHDNTALKQQVFALRQDKATLESQVAHLRPLATSVVRKVASLSREKKKLMKEKDNLLGEAKINVPKLLPVLLASPSGSFLLLHELLLLPAE
jgi:chromosome segregation ATPase